MDLLEEEILHLWKALFNHQVRYLMIGRFAINLHGYQRFTGDIDLWLEDTLPNRKALREAFIQAGLGDFEQLAYIDFIPGRTDFYWSEGWNAVEK